MIAGHKDKKGGDYEPEAPITDGTQYAMLASGAVRLEDVLRGHLSGFLAG